MISMGFSILFWLLLSFTERFYENTIILTLLEFVSSLFIIWAVVKTLYKVDFWKWTLAWFLQYIGCIVFLIPIVLIVKSFITLWFNVVWSAMSPTINDWDFIVVEKISKKKSFQRWDIITFTSPSQDISYIKRIIWLPGETIKIQSWSIFVCKDICEQIIEDYLPENRKTEPLCNKTEFLIKEWYFVMWDNRWSSTDSLCCFWQAWDWCSNGENYEVFYENTLWRVFGRIFPNKTSF